MLQNLSYFSNKMCGIFYAFFCRLFLWYFVFSLNQCRLFSFLWPFFQQFLSFPLVVPFQHLYVLLVCRLCLFFNKISSCRFLSSFTIVFFTFLCRFLSSPGGCLLFNIFTSSSVFKYQCCRLYQYFYFVFSVVVSLPSNATGSNPRNSQILLLSSEEENNV